MRPQSGKDSPVASKDSPVSAKDSTLASKDAPISGTDSTLASMGAPLSGTHSTLASTPAPLSVKDTPLAWKGAPLSGTDSTLASTPAPLSGRGSYFATTRDAVGDMETSLPRTDISIVTKSARRSGVLSSIWGDTMPAGVRRPADCGRSPPTGTPAGAVVVQPQSEERATRPPGARGAGPKPRR
jgi:hypothetical protein